MDGEAPAPDLGAPRTAERCHPQREHLCGRGAHIRVRCADPSCRRRPSADRRSCPRCHRAALDQASRRRHRLGPIRYLAGRTRRRQPVTPAQEPPARSKKTSAGEQPCRAASASSSAQGRVARATRRRCLRARRVCLTERMWRCASRDGHVGGQGAWVKVVLSRVGAGLELDLTLRGGCAGLQLMGDN